MTFDVQENSQGREGGPFTFYKTATGEVSRLVGVSVIDLAVANLAEDETMVRGHFQPKTHYFVDGQPTERPASPVTRTDLTLHDVPNGATLWINGVSYDAEGEVELEFPLPGAYSLRVECFPYLDWTGEVVIP